MQVRPEEVFDEDSFKVMAFLITTACPNFTEQGIKALDAKGLIDIIKLSIHAYSIVINDLKKYEKQLLTNF